MLKLEYKDILLVMLFRKLNKPASHKAYHILGSQKIIPISQISLPEYIVYSGLFYPCFQVELSS